MLISERKHKVEISFNQKIEGIVLTLVDGTLETVYTGMAQQLDLELSEGIYKLKAKFIDYYQEYTLIIDENKKIYLDFDYPSVAPIFSFKTNHEYLYVNSEYYSKVITDQSMECQPNFLFFLAKYDKDKFPNLVVGNLLEIYSIVNSENEILFQFNSENTKFNDDEGWLIFSNKLTNGLFFLRYKLGEESRIFPFYIYDNYQTQFFIRYSQTADFDNCFFFYTKEMCFKFDAEEYLIFDKILFCYRDYKNYKFLTDSDKYIIRQTPYLITLIHLLKIELSENLEYENLEYLLLPDLLILNGNVTDYTEQIPIISFVMTKYACNSEKRHISINPASIVDRIIDNVKYDLFWNNFSKIDNTNDWREPYTKFLLKSDFFPVSGRDSLATKLVKKVANTVLKIRKSTLEERVNSLIEKNKSENHESKVNETFNSISAISAIATKLKLPPTKVLRNYGIYKDIYDKLK